MSYFHDVEYITRLNFRLRNFKRRGDVFNFSCPLCGDSKKNSKKARGYIFKSKSNTFLFKCYNCNESTSFSNFLKKLDPQYYSEYITYTNHSLFSKESSSLQQPLKTMDSENSIFDASNALITKEKFGDFFQKIENLPKNHVAIQYLISRKIPQEKIETEFYYTDDFRKSTIDILTAANQPTESYTSLRSHDARIIIPFVDENQNVLGFQGRTLNPNNKVRYITIKINPESSKIYGLNMLDRAQDKIYVLEGPIDSMFIPNSVAVMDANLTKAEKLLADKGVPKEKLILVFDNEPRSENIVKAMSTAIQKGLSIVILPENDKEIQSCKDINDLVKTKNYSASEVLHLLESNTYSNDTTASRFITQLKFRNWKKVS